MHKLTCESYLFHDHSFGQEARRPQERRAITVTLLTLVVMAVEIIAGINGTFGGRHPYGNPRFGAWSGSGGLHLFPPPRG